MTDIYQLGQRGEPPTGFRLSIAIFDFPARLVHLSFWGGMMQWKKDLESLVEQTRAMVRHAGPKGGEPAAQSEKPTPPEPIVRSSPPAESSPSVQSSPLAESSLPHKWAMPQLKWDRPAREEIMQRVEGFRAHQEKLRREREDYYLQMTEKVRAILRDDVQHGRAPGPDEGLPGWRLAQLRSLPVTAPSDIMPADRVHSPPSASSAPLPLAVPSAAGLKGRSAISLPNPSTTSPRLPAPWS